jgi:hypothetical protein
MHSDRRHTSATICKHVANVSVRICLDRNEIVLCDPSNVADFVTEHAHSIGFDRIAKFGPLDTTGTSLLCSS